ncbi:hypothetical protein GGG16DRAFT_107059, partial [Schizophyllum commune]
DDVRALNERALTREEKALRDSGQHLADVDFGADDGIYTAGVVARGESSRTLSWIWYSVPQDPSLSDSVQNEALRVEYLKSKARRDRHREEIRLLLEEMRRVIASNEADAAEWQQRASSRTCEDKQLREGLQSYALEHAARARDRAARLSEKWKDIRHRAEDALALRFDGAHTLREAEARQELDDLTDTLNDSPDDGDEATRASAPLLFHFPGYLGINAFARASPPVAGAVSMSTHLQDFPRPSETDSPNAWQAATQQREQHAATAPTAINGRYRQTG